MTLSLDVKNQTLEDARAKMSAAIDNGNSEEFTSAFLEMAKEMQAGILEDAKKELRYDQLDAQALTARGVRQLTSEEKEFYKGTIEAMRSTNPQQALKDLKVVLPETVIDAVFDDLKQNHELLSVIDFKNTTAITKIIVNMHHDQLATWDELNTPIVTEIMSGFKVFDVSLKKLTAFIPVSKDMLDLGPVWLDRYVREILGEALALGLEEGILNGDGNKAPIGMIRQVGDDVSVTGGKYPEKKAVKVETLDVETYGKLLSGIAKYSKGKGSDGKEVFGNRVISEIIMVVNPADYFTKVFPATTIKGLDGTYRKDVLPFPTRVIQSERMAAGKAIIGVANGYFMGVGTAKSGKIEYSDDYKFLEDQRIYITKLYGNGMPKDNNAFVVADISGLKPTYPKVEVVGKEAKPAE